MTVEHDPLNEGVVEEAVHKTKLFDSEQEMLVFRTPETMELDCANIMDDGIVNVPLVVGVTEIDFSNLVGMFHKLARELGHYAGVERSFLEPVVKSNYYPNGKATIDGHIKQGFVREIKHNGAAIIIPLKVI